ncbi:MAG: rhomboid family intramembrane serine protease [Treponema sp.]|nr:rhomboid family intramembrane serine protease [Treponema sp.]
MKIIRRPFRYRNDNVVYYLIGITFLFYLAQLFLRSIPIVGIFSMNPIIVMRLGWVWQFTTYMFIHHPTNIGHILFNMFALFIFGRQVEWKMGSREFLLYYLLTGTLAGIFSFFVYTLTGQVWISLMGASGAIFAVQFAYATFFPDSVIYIWGILPLRAPIMVLGFTGIELFSMFTRSGGNVAHITHLAGFLFAWVYFSVRFGINPWKAMRRR